MRRRLAIVLFLIIALLPLAAPDAAARWRRRRNEARAVGALRTIATAEPICRESDRSWRRTKGPDHELDYDTLAELGLEELIDATLASGTKDGHVFRAAPSATTPELLWWGTAEPEVPGVTGDLFYFVNHAGEIGASSSPIAVDTRTGATADALFPVRR